MKNFTLAVAVAVVTLVPWSGAILAKEARAPRPEIVVVYKSPWCGCCQGWVEHMRASGFEVTVREQEDLTAIKRMSGVPEELQSCHTAFVGGYAIEGHVPAGMIERLLADRPPVRGLAVPGMPIGSPGMEGADPEPYEVMTFTQGGTATVYERVRPE
jgi:hypothetical protein